MLRNKEIRMLILTLCMISIAAATVAAAFFSTEIIILVVVISLLFICISLGFTHWRYREVARLTGYLRKISSGEYTLDVRDNQEGELSILKNEIYKVTLMLSEQTSHLQQDKKQLKDAISDISHQLKTPLTSMLMMADLLSDPNLEEPKRSEFTRNIQLQLERMEWLVSSLLKLSKIDAGTIQFKKDPIPVPKLVNKAFEPLRIPVEIKEHTVHIEGDESVTFQGDFNWTAEALINILKNCVEHTQKGGRVRLSFSENVLFTEIVIEDNGIGIAKEDLPHIFKRFYKGKNAYEGSVGIGLAMAHSIIKGQNGDLQVSSEKGKGTRFTIKFYKQII